MDSRINKTITLFELFYQVVSGNREFEYRPKDRDRKMIENFIKSLSISHDSDWLYDYFAFQFQRYSTMKTRFGKGKIMLGWIIGQKSLKYYRDASDEEKYWGEQFKEIHNIKNPFKEEIQKVDFSAINDQERVRFYNTEKGLVHCTELRLFNSLNKFCKFCKNKEYCV